MSPRGEPNKMTAKLAAAFGDFDPTSAVVVDPDADRAGRSSSNAGGTADDNRATQAPRRVGSSKFPTSGPR